MFRKGAREDQHVLQEWIGELLDENKPKDNGEGFSQDSWGMSQIGSYTANEGMNNPNLFRPPRIGDDTEDKIGRVTRRIRNTAPGPDGIPFLAWRTLGLMGVDILWEVTETLMRIEAEESGADIRRQCTAGSISQHVWRHTLLKHIPKLATEWEHDLWQKTNRGGFCGACD